MRDPAVVRELHDLTARLGQQRKSLLFMGPVVEIPIDLQKEAFEFELPMPGLEDMPNELAGVLEQLEKSGQAVPDLPPNSRKSCSRPSSASPPAKPIRHCSWPWPGATSSTTKSSRPSWPRSGTWQGSDLLDFYDLEEGVKDVGGLEILKDWLSQRAEAFSERAREQGIPIPKGVLLLGIQGCGKSLTARAAAQAP